MEHLAESRLFLGRYNDILALCFLSEASVKFRFFIGDCHQRDVGPFNLKRSFQNPFVMFTADRVSVREFVPEGRQVREHSFSVLCDEGIITDIVTSNESVVFITENQEIQGIVSSKLSDTEVMVFHHVNNNSHGTLVTFQDEGRVQVQHVASVPGFVGQIINVHGCENLVICADSNNLYLLNIERRKCLKVIQTDEKPSIIGAMLSSRGHILLWQHSKESSLYLSVFTTSGIRRLKCIPSDEVTENTWFLQAKKEQFFFVNGDKLLILTWTESGNPPPKIDVMSKFDKFPLL